MTSYLSLNELRTGRLTLIDGSVYVCIPGYEFKRPLQDVLAGKTTHPDITQECTYLLALDEV